MAITHAAESGDHAVSLPPHVAPDDEPLMSLGKRPHDGPDLRKALPIADMLHNLAELADDVVGYLELWRRYTTSAGCEVSLSYARNGDECLRFTLPCDAQVRHRNRYMHFLGEDLHADDERYKTLARILHDEGHYSDNRPADPRATTAAIRAFLRISGRIMITPSGRLLEGGELPALILNGTDEQVAECRRATRAYYEARRRWSSEPQIKRAVRMLGTRTDNGWIVLGETPPRPNAVRTVAAAIKQQRMGGDVVPTTKRKRSKAVVPAVASTPAALAQERQPEAVAA
jgi:hypothetical protein